jgi:hypothetical protein
MPCLALQLDFSEASNESERLPSWRSIAALVRSRAQGLVAAEAEDLLSFADFLDGFAELEK